MRTCIECGAKVEKFEKDGREHYRCEKGHENTRMEFHDEVESYEEDGETIHCSVGAAIVHDGEVLVLKRRKYPYALTIPAGHLEPSDESPEKAVVREIREEAGLEANPHELEKLFEGRIEDPCRRGADYHDWDFYILELDQRPEIQVNDEAESFEWFRPEQLNGKDLTAPTEKFIVEKQLLTQKE